MKTSVEYQQGKLAEIHCEHTSTENIYEGLTNVYAEIKFGALTRSFEYVSTDIELTDLSYIEISKKCFLEVVRNRKESIVEWINENL